MTPFFLAVALIIAFATTCLVVPIVRRVALKCNWVDAPDLERKNHARPTPNVGGLAIVAGFVAGLLSLLIFQKVFSFEMALPHLAVLGGALVMVITGFYDDVHGLSFKRKFLIQIVVAYLLLVAGFRLDVADLSFLDANPYHQALYSIPLTMIWIVGIINAVNLLDGLDGLASGVSMILFASLAAIFAVHGGDLGMIMLAILMIGATAGFLIHNFSPASIFMGDSGSLFLGFMLAAYSLQGESHTDPVLAILVPIVALGLLVLDTGLCMVRRIVDGISPFSPDSDHIHHRLRKLFSTRRAVLILYAIATWFGVAAVLITQFDLLVGLLIIGVTAVAAFVGIRTLGYLDLRSFVGKRRLKEAQLLLNLEELQDPLDTRSVETHLWKRVLKSRSSVSQQNQSSKSSSHLPIETEVYELSSGLMVPHSHNGSSGNGTHPSAVDGDGTGRFGSNSPRKNRAQLEAESESSPQTLDYDSDENAKSDNRLHRDSAELQS